MADNSSTSSSRSHVRVAVKLAAFLAIVIVLDHAGGLFHAWLHQRTLEGDFGGCVNATLRQRNDAVIFGPSTAKAHFDPAVLAEGTGRTFWNAGVMAQHLLFHYCVEQLLLDEYVPKAIILEFNKDDLRKRNGTEVFDKLAPLLPFYARHNANANAMLCMRSPYERVKLLSWLYPYNSQIIPLIKYALNAGQSTARTNGFEPYHGSDVLQIESMRKAHDTRKIRPFESDPFFEDVLRRFIRTAQARGVKVICCQSPTWKSEDVAEDPYADLVKRYRAILSELNVPLIEITQETQPEFRDPSLFKDRVHLNEKGAALYSRLVAERLKPLL